MNVGSTTDPTANTPATNTPVTAQSGQPILGEDDFLQMLVAQLKNQDPTDPMDATQFAGELAAFSTVEQLTQLNTTATSQTSALSESALAQEAMLGSNLIGRDVVLQGANVTVDGTDPSRVSVDLAGAAQKVTIEVMSADGKNTLSTQTFNNVGAGSQLLTLDTSNLDPGTYTYQVTATDAQGAAVQTTPFTVGHVQGSGFSNGAVTLTINGQDVPITDVVEIVPAATAGSTSTN